MEGPFVVLESADPGIGLASAAGTALTSVLAGRCDLPSWLLALPALSGRRFRLWLHAMMQALEGGHLLEIGTGTGSTALSAAWRNGARVTTIDNWADGPAALAAFNAHRSLLRAPDAVTQLAADFRAVDYAALPSADVFFYDGPLKAGDVGAALRLVQPALRDQCVLVIDDWNFPPLREEALAVMADLALPVIWSAELRTTLDGSHPAVGGEESDWHNGCFIAVMDRARAGATRRLMALRLDGGRHGVVGMPEALPPLHVVDYRLEGGAQPGDRSLRPRGTGQTSTF
ncbi:class I SAM-dependent methyltransferase [Acidisphaera rubrifaciens]|uniref:O-methyltransferase n=1 Tax=Acidisphaera rubrifaciens HS-AP3 TaxID=1231350 RepID=A0A0D6P9Y1_9PROT|nr:class I SAM-dependent methyltransferase [Acidisphaera rubrifaciens]GAN78146.1 hypothetical protein Asru_0653_03 [Acidisphaera rubrifaciens HS-AP3]